MRLCVAIAYSLEGEEKEKKKDKEEEKKGEEEEALLALPDRALAEGLC